MNLDGLLQLIERARVSNLSVIPTSTRFIAALAAVALSFTMPVSAGVIGNCAAEYTTGQGGLNCTAADDGGTVEDINTPSFCVIGQGLTFDVLTSYENGTNASRYDPRYWIAIDGGDVRDTAAQGGPAVCSLSGLDIGIPIEVTDEEANGDTCGDVAGNVNFPPTNIDTVTLDCIPDANGLVQFNTAVTWETSASLDCAIDNLRGPPGPSISKSQAACVETTLDSESLGRVTVIKSAPEDDGNTDFVFNWSTNSPPQAPANQGLNPADPFFLADGGNQGILYALVTSGGSAVVTVTEQDPSGLGYTLASVDCPGASVNQIPGGVEVTLTYDVNNPGLADVTCTFNNVAVQANPGMSVSKTSTTGAIMAPGAVTYDYVVTNLGNVELTGVSLVDDNIDGNVFCPSNTVAVGATMDCSATHTVTQAEIDDNGSPTPGSGMLSNMVTASSNETGNETDDLDIPITQTPSMTIDKVGTFNGGAFAQVGDTISYTFEVSNTGNVTLTNVAVTDPLVSPITCPSGNNPILSLAPGDSETCTGSYTVVQADIDAGQRDNIGTGDSVQTPPVTDPETVPLGQNPTMTVVKSSGTTLISAPGAVSYGYLVTNTGNQTLTGISLSDDNTDGAVTCPDTTLSPGDSFICTAQHTVTQGELDANGSPIADSGNLVNNVTATSTEAPDATDDLSIPLAQTPSVEIVKNGTWNDDGSTPNIAEVGETISYTFVVSNDGNLTLSNVAVTDPLVSPITCETNNPILSLPPGGSEQCTGTYVLLQSDVDAGQRDNTATATGSSPGGNDDVTDQDSDSVNLPATADILIDKEGTYNGGALAQVGDTISYTFAVTNNGSSTLTNVLVSDPLVPAISCSSGNNPIVSLGVGVTETCTGSYTLTQDDIDAGQVDNTGTADSTEAGPVTDDETVMLPTNAALDLDKAGTYNGGANAQVGDTISYTFTVSNTGNITLTLISVIDPLVAPITCPSGNPIPSMLPGGSEECTGTYTLVQADIDAGQRDNTATANSVQTEPVMDSESVPLPQGLLLTVVKSSPTSSIGAPQDVSYGYLVTNAGTTTLTAIMLVDDNITSAMSCPDTTLAPSDSFICTATKIVTQGDVDNNGSPVADSGELLNNVTASSAEAPDATDSLSIPFVSGAGISVVKSSTTTEVISAGVVDYSYFVVNTGDVTLTGVRIDDDNDEDDASCAATTLSPGENTTCTATHNVTAGEITDGGSPVADSGFLVNNATAFGSSPDNTDDVSDTDSLSIPFVEGAGRFTVVKDFSDDNPATVDVAIICNSGLPLQQEFTISEGHQVTFTLASYIAGATKCEITEVVPDGYTPDYFNGDVNSAVSCVYEDIPAGANFSCLIYNELNPVTVVVNKEWTGVTEDDGIDLIAYAHYECTGVRSAADSDTLTSVDGSLNFEGELDSEVISDLYPDYGGNSNCAVTELQLPSAAEGDDSECADLPISLGQGNSCTIHNTVFFEGIPTLNQYGLMLLALLMLAVGVIGFRRHM